MPTFAYCSPPIREMVEGLTVALHTRHVFASGSASDDVLELKGRIPDDVDVILGSDLVFIIAGTVKSGRVASGVVRRSAVAKHIIDYFRTVSMFLSH